MRFKRKLLAWSLVSVAAMAVCGELFARYALGLGTPPIYVAIPGIEYLLRPNQDVYRFGNHFIVNQYGMRTAPFPESKGEGEFRMMVFGDSVLNGGNQTDHAALATTLLQESLSRKRGNAVVGNISASSWGPGNWLAYARQYGFFGADVVALVISSHDYADNPTFQPLNKNTHPTETPVSALVEGATRYLPRYLPQLATSSDGSEPDRFEEQADEQAAAMGLEDLKSFLALARKNSAVVVVLQHWEKSEIEKGFANPGNQRIREACQTLGISPVSLEPYFRRSMADGGNPYRDNIHPNELGQQLIAEAILANLP